MRTLFSRTKLCTALLGLCLLFPLAAWSETPPAYFRTLIYVDSVKTAESALKQVKPDSLLQAIERAPEQIEAPVYRATIDGNLSERLPIPDAEYLQRFGRGLDREQVSQVQTYQAAIVVDTIFPRSRVLETVPAMNRFAKALADASDGYIWDSETRELFTAQAWQENRLDAWQAGVPVISRHTVIHAYKNGEHIRAITLGMAKFGLPDIVINDFSWSMNRSMGNLINLISQSLAEGVLPDNKGHLKISIDSLKDTDFKQSLTASLHENAVGQIALKLVPVVAEPGDPDNTLWTVDFSHSPGNSVQEKQEALTTLLFGSYDEVSYVKHTKAIEEASRQARAQLPGLKRAFENDFQPGEYLLLKAPFDTPDGGTEWMWVEVMRWENKAITGLLRNEPRHIPTLKAGSTVTVDEADIFDFIHQLADGSREGNETGRLMAQFQSN